MFPTVRSNRIPARIRFPKLTAALALAAAALGVTLTAAPARADAPPDPLAALSEDVLAALNSASFQLPGLPLVAGLGADTAIVVLGYGLEPDGAMRPELADRLSAAYVQAMLTPNAPIVVTGGNPENGITEAQVMADWLVGRGIPPHRIHIEDRAESTIENAEYSAEMMGTIGANSAVLVTSSDHVQRAQGDFVAAGVTVVATLTPDQAPPAVVPFGSP
ncbi:YdcF family protein [Nocardia mexicana]|uniref:DUF218 domain-containing protein n=1 Tax=Nocardia mexicana TaxID=279262 RepID=A0A370H1R5_9NOCA|nr:YdcF family protein [Nocardia mexicana]RDI49903.1 DUF218 domain-containing protein [Nocardia mexicana]